MVNELRTLQNEAAFDYLKVENETYELLDEINKSDEILGSNCNFSFSNIYLKISPNFQHFESALSDNDRRTGRCAQKF